MHSGLCEKTTSAPKQISPNKLARQTVCKLLQDRKGGTMKWISRKWGPKMHSYENRARIFNLEILLAALIALAILTFELFATWSAFERSISPIKDQTACL
jgi:hypothetical protein